MTSIHYQPTIKFADFIYCDDNLEIIESIFASLNISESTGNPKKTKSNIFFIADKDPIISNLVKLDRACCEIAFANTFRDIEDLTVKLRKYFSEFYRIELSGEDSKDIINYVSNTNTFNSIIDELSRYERPSVNPLYEVLAFIEFEATKNPDVHFQILDLFLKKTLIKILSVDMPWLSYPNDIVPILKGCQGIGKTLFIRWLAGYDYYVELGTVHGGDLTSKDTLLKIRRKMFAEIGELAVLNRTGIEAVKAFVSTAEDEYRPPYARATKKIPRTASFIGTTNQDEYLSDVTGNRRFFPLNIIKIDFALFKESDLQKSLLSYYFHWANEFLNGGEDIIKSKLLDLNILSPELIEYLNAVRQDARIRSNYDNQIQEYILAVKTRQWDRIKRNDSRTFFEYYNSGECGVFIFTYPGSIPRDFPKYFSAAMREHGFINITGSRIAGKKMKHWVPSKNSGTVGTVEPLSINSNTYNSIPTTDMGVSKQTGSTVPEFHDQDIDNQWPGSF